MPRLRKRVPEVDHGIEEAIYNNLPFQHPVMICLCGYTTDDDGAASNWEEAGASLDRHLEVSQ
jgi:hypothetical protein